MNRTDNPYLPYPVRIDQIVTETEDQKLKTFKLVFLNPEDEEKFKYIPGQFAELSVPGRGEVPMGIASSPTEKGFLSFSSGVLSIVEHQAEDSHHRVAEGTEEGDFVCRRDTERQNGLPQKDMVDRRRLRCFRENRYLPILPKNIDLCDLRVTAVKKRFSREVRHG
jgi:hypothetical protein